MKHTYKKDEELRKRGFKMIVYEDGKDRDYYWEKKKEKYLIYYASTTRDEYWIEIRNGKKDWDMRDGEWTILKYFTGKNAFDKFINSYMNAILIV